MHQANKDSHSSTEARSTREPDSATLISKRENRSISTSILTHKPRKATSAPSSDPVSPDRDQHRGNPWPPEPPSHQSAPAKHNTEQFAKQTTPVLEKSLDSSSDLRDLRDKARRNVVRDMMSAISNDVLASQHRDPNHSRSPSKRGPTVNARATEQRHGHLRSIIKRVPTDL